MKIYIIYGTIGHELTRIGGVFLFLVPASACPLHGTASPSYTRGHSGEWGGGPRSRTTENHTAPASLKAVVYLCRYAYMCICVYVYVCVYVCVNVCVMCVCVCVCVCVCTCMYVCVYVCMCVCVCVTLCTNDTCMYPSSCCVCMQKRPTSA